MRQLGNAFSVTARGFVVGIHPGNRTKRKQPTCYCVGSRESDVIPFLQTHPPILHDGMIVEASLSHVGPQRQLYFCGPHGTGCVLEVQLQNICGRTNMPSAIPWRAGVQFCEPGHGTVFASYRPADGTHGEQALDLIHIKRGGYCIAVMEDLRTIMRIGVDSKGTPLINLGVDHNFLFNSLVKLGWHSTKLRPRVVDALTKMLDMCDARERREDALRELKRALP